MVDEPDLLPLLADRPVILAPADLAETLADVLDVALAGEVPYVVLIYAALFVSQMSVSLLNGLGQGRASFVATLSSSAVTVAVVLPLVYRFGLHGALVGGTIPMLVQLGVALWMIRRVERRAAQVEA